MANRRHDSPSRTTDGAEAIKQIEAIDLEAQRRELGLTRMAFAALRVALQGPAAVEALKAEMGERPSTGAERARLRLFSLLKQNGAHGQTDKVDEAPGPSWTGKAKIRGRRLANAVWLLASDLVSPMPRQAASHGIRLGAQIGDASSVCQEVYTVDLARVLGDATVRASLPWMRPQLTIKRFPEADNRRVTFAAHVDSLPVNGNSPRLCILLRAADSEVLEIVLSQTIPSDTASWSRTETFSDLAIGIAVDG